MSSAARHRALTDAIERHAMKVVSNPSINLPTGREYLATWLSAEASDSSLSQVLIQGGSLCRFVPKLSHVTGLSSGDLIVLRGLGPGRLYVAGKLVGDITLATVSTDSTPPSGVGTVSVTSITTTSASASWSAATDNDAVAGYEVFVNNRFVAFTTSTSVGLTGLAAGTSYTVKVHAKDRAGNTGADSSTVFVTTSSGVTGTFDANWKASWSASYNFNGDNEYDSWFKSTAYQGQDAGSNQRSLIGFNWSSIVSTVGSATINSCHLKLTYAHWWKNSGGTAVIGTSTAASRPSTWSGTSNRKQSGGWGRGQTRTVDLGVGIGNDFASGSAKAICLGPGPSSSTTYYGYAYGANSGIYTPTLYITYSL